ncbi:B-cell receptor CD22-like [Mauremys reevesii]|uniref:B-cell receptor CD22-like n=1 Tax=Mauremys reevesii TaxID=260615 RepID=UPI00193F6063|nr:B-cell receptor CD22-like [Mauremys reevesii]
MAGRHRPAQTSSHPEMLQVTHSQPLSPPGRLSALCWTEMAWVLVAAFCLLSGAYAQEWNVTLGPEPPDGWATSCVTILCSFTYPADQCRKAALREGDGFTLRCQAAALWPVARYVWSRGDVWLPEAGQDLRVDKAAVSDGGSYACGVWVSGPGWGYLSLSARESVEVQHAPTGVRVTAAPGTSLQEGESVTLTCSYTSSLPAPTSYAWYRGDWQLGGSRRETVMKSITVEQAGEYRCQADNGIGQSLSPPINITVRCCQCLGPGIVACIVVAILLLVILSNAGLCYLLMRGWRQAGAERAAEGAEFSLGPETESPYEELQGPTQDIYSQLDSPRAGSH